MTLRASGTRPSGDTKGRILDAAEDLFIEHGFEAMSLRQITAHAEVNLAAVNYHFGSKEALIHSMLARRLDRLNLERLKLLDRFEKRFADAGEGAGLTCEHVLGALFIPALRLSRDPQHGGRAFLRLLGRAYTDPSSFVREFLAQHYASVSDRIFAAFAHALPHLPREELGWRLNFSIGALSGVLAGSDTNRLIAQFAHGEPLGDADAVEAQAAAEEEAERAAREKSNEIERDAQTLNSSGGGNVNPSGETDAGKSRGSGGMSRPSGNGTGGASGSSAVGDPSQKIHASTGGSRTPISWPGSTTAGSFRYRVF